MDHETRHVLPHTYVAVHASIEGALTHVRQAGLDAVSVLRCHPAFAVQWNVFGGAGKVLFLVTFPGDQRAYVHELDLGGWRALLDVAARERLRTVPPVARRRAR